MWAQPFHSAAEAVAKELAAGAMAVKWPHGLQSVSAGTATSVHLSGYYDVVHALVF